MTYLFIDTNIFLHFRFFEEIPWRQFTDSDFILMIAPTVIKELDKHKRNPNGKVASRAKKVLARIEAIAEASNNYPLQCILEIPLKDTLETYHLDRQEQDDLLIATILDFRNNNPERAVMFITYDTGPLLKARLFDINARKMDEAFMPQAEKSPEEKELEKLSKELAAYKNAIPKLKLAFRDEKEILKVNLTPIPESQQDFVERRFQEETAHLQPLDYEDSGDQLNQFLRKYQVEEFNKELNYYLRLYRRYLKQKYLYQKLNSLRLPINLVLHNYGTYPAQEIDILLHFPDGFMLINEDELPDEPIAPAPPHRPTGPLDFGPMPIIDSNNFQHWLNSPAIPPDGYAGRPNILKGDSYIVNNISYPSLKHCHQQLLEPLIVIFQDRDNVINFNIEYRIFATNLPEPVFGQLHVIVETK